MTEESPSIAQELQYIHGPGLKACHVVAIKMYAKQPTDGRYLMGVRTGCSQLITIVGTDRELTEPGVGTAKGTRLCKKCEEALLWWRHRGEWTKP